MKGKNVTIEDVKKNKIKLESDIMKLAQDFEKENGVFVSYLNFNRKRNNDNEVAPASYDKEKGPIKNEEINMDLDLIY